MAKKQNPSQREPQSKDVDGLVFPNKDKGQIEQPSKKGGGKGILIGLTLVLVVVLLGLGSWALWRYVIVSPGPKPPAPPKPPTPVSELKAEGFAEYEEIPVEVTPQVKLYEVKADLSNVTNKDKFEISAGAKKLLADNAFVVIPPKLGPEGTTVSGAKKKAQADQEFKAESGQSYKEFYQLYEANRYSEVPGFITTDVLLHTYHLLFDSILRNTEIVHLIPILSELNTEMLSISQTQYVELSDPEWKDAAKRNIGFFSVSQKILDPNFQIPSEVASEVEEEIKLMEAHAGMSPSVVLNIGKPESEWLKEDFSQYIPRGHYTKTEDLKKYFKAMMYYGRITFRAKFESETKGAALLTQGLLENQKAYSAWEKIYEPTNFFVGKSDDLGVYQYSPALEEVYGKNVKVADLIEPAKFSAFHEKTKQMEPPQINSMPIFDESIEPDRESEIKGFRFMGQRFTMDAAIMQKLVYRDVKENDKGERRMLPKGLDVAAALGSEEAYKILEDLGETKYEKYPENMSKLKEYLKGLDQKIWTQNLYWSWLYSFLPLLEEKEEGYPSFMQTLAWMHKGLNTVLASWTELKHDTILYAKQVYAELGGGPEEKPLGYVEPEPEFYGRLASLIKMTKDGLSSRNILTDKNKENLDQLYEMALNCKTIAEKELGNKPLSNEDRDFIYYIGGSLEELAKAAAETAGEEGTPTVLDEEEAAIVADVATDPDSQQVLEEATGKIHELYVVVPGEDGLRLTRGGAFAYYEFPWPMSDRLTDEKWRKMLNEGQTPDQPEWTKDFISL